MRNKTGNMYGRLSAMLMFVALLTAVLVLTALPAAVTAEVGENLCEGFDPTFETQTETTIPATATRPKGGFEGDAKVDVGGHGGNGVNDVNGKSLKLATAGDGIQFAVPVKSQTNYTFSFWMKNSKEGALEMPETTRFYYTNYNNASFGSKGNWSDEMKANIDWTHTSVTVYLNKFDRKTDDNTYQDLFFTFGANREGADIDVWRQVNINFTTPYAYVGSVMFHLKAKETDEYLAIDDISVVETGFAPNDIFNGNLEAIRYDRETPELSTLTTDSIGGNEVSIVVDPDDANNHVYKIYCPENNESITAPSLFVSNGSFFPRGINLGTRYKLSFRSKANEERGVNLRMRNIGVTNKNIADFKFDLSSTTEWRTHTLYIDATKAAEAGKLLTNRALYFGYSRLTNGQTLYLDDLYSWYDESGIGFYELLKFNNDSTNGDRYLDYTDTEYTGVPADLTNIVMQETSVEAKNIASLSQNGDGTRTVITRAHYLPEANRSIENGATTVSFVPTDVTLLSAVYRYEKDENGKKIENTKRLVDVFIESGSSSVKGETIDVVDEVTIPKVENGEIYEVESMAWNMKDGMKPIITADKEQRTLKFE